MIRNKKILVLGSRGFIGSKFCEKVSSKNIVIKPFFKKLKSNYFNLSNFNSQKINYLIKKNNLDYILNFHAHTDVKYSNFNPRYDFYHNCSLTHSIINALIENKSKAFFLNFGTVTQLGYTNTKNKINQNYKGNPITIFDLHKQYNEDYISIYKKLFNLNATTLRLSNVYGIGHSYSKNRGVINKIIDRAISEKKITLYGDGSYVRDFIYLEDVIMGIIYALKYCNKLHKDYYYLTTDIGKSFNNLAKIINSELFKIYKFTAKIKYKKWPNTSILLDKRSFVGNSFLFKKVTGWKSKYSLRSSIKHYIRNKKLQTNK
jgi:nucleoside-diphosphate-sugar epimerase